MAFGDTFNDAEMLKAAKYGFLVENGSPALREEVPFLAPPNTSSGVMQVLRRVLAQNGRSVNRISEEQNRERHRRKAQMRSFLLV